MTTKRPSTALVATAFTKAAPNGVTNPETVLKYRRILLIHLFPHTLVFVKRFRGLWGCRGRDRGKLGTIITDLSRVDNNVLQPQEVQKLRKST